MIKQILSGCRPTPLASYLKALGLVRILWEQKDPTVQGWWEDETFVIKTDLDQTGLVNFFCEEYAPTPIVSPWNGGSGFYLGDSTKAKDAIIGSPDKRFELYRKVILEIEGWRELPKFETLEDILLTLRDSLENMRPGKKRKELEELIGEVDSSSGRLKGISEGRPSTISLEGIENRAGKGGAEQEKWRDFWNVVKKARTQSKTLKRSADKDKILPASRNRLPDAVLDWIDAVCALPVEGRPSFNPVLGTGGNEGRLEFSNNFMQRLVELFITGDPEKTKSLFRSAVFGDILSGLAEGKIGQYDPGRAGGYNQGMEIETKEFKINPWDFALAIEGSLFLAGAVARRNPTEDRSRFTIPFTVLFSAVGFSSSAYLESGRYETWLPVWRNPASFPEIKYLFAEGRASLGRRVAKTGIEFSRAVGKLGVDRGIDSFERYAFLARRSGKSYVALPVGRIPVHFNPSLELIDELDPSIMQVEFFLRRLLKEYKKIPAAFLSARQRIDEAIFACTQKPDPLAFSHLVRAIGSLEELLAFRDRSKKPKLDSPLSGLSPRWIAASDDGSVEVRIAAALASIRSTGEVGPLRSNVAGIDPSNPRHWAEGRGQKSWFGNNFAARLAGVLTQRLLDATRTSTTTIPVEGRLPISAHDISPFLWEECDDAKIEELLWGFSLIDWFKPGLKALKERWENPITEYPLSRSWCLLKLLHIPTKVRGVKIHMEPRIVSLLSSGRVKDACDLATRRLRISELHPFEVSYEDELNPVRLMASLLIPVKDQWRMEWLVLEPKTL
ncbi:MAG: type I-U CRISPR-associated protein Csx17 [Thermodesulfobacteriota bacterium]